MEYPTTIDPAARPGTTYLSNFRIDWIRQALGSDLLLENWKYHPGDNSLWANPAFDDNDWETTTTLLAPTNLPIKGWDDVGWFRIHWVVDSMLINKPLGLSIMQAGASKFFLDGSLLYRFDERRNEWSGIPKPVIFTGKQRHILAVRYTNKSLGKFRTANLYAGYTVRLGNLNTMVEDAHHNERLRWIPNVSHSAAACDWTCPFALIYIFPGDTTTFVFCVFPVCLCCCHFFLITKYYYQ